MQQKSTGGVDMPPLYSRKGLRGWMSTMSTRFPYKERRIGKIMKIALTRLTSTPLTPTRSKAEACQPLGVIHAAWQGRDHETAPGDGRGHGGQAPTPSPSIERKIIKILLLSLIGTFRETGKLIHHRPCFCWLALSERCRCHGLDMQRKSLAGVDTSQPYSRKGLGGWMTNVSR